LEFAQHPGDMTLSDHASSFDLARAADFSGAPKRREKGFARQPHGELRK
jgi:hypothetical protein